MQHKGHHRHFEYKDLVHKKYDILPVIQKSNNKLDSNFQEFYAGETHAIESGKCEMKFKYFVRFYVQFRKRI